MGNLPINLNCLCPQDDQDDKEDIEEIKKSIHKMETNHLYHIEADIKKNTESISEIKLDIREIKMILFTIKQ
tara:strand:- start:21 stop:236 length:216 start_codon:yes stop_codon:yes gene_type:complete